MKLARKGVLMGLAISMHKGSTSLVCAQRQPGTRGFIQAGFEILNVHKVALDKVVEG